MKRLAIVVAVLMLGLAGTAHADLANVAFVGVDPGTGVNLTISGNVINGAQTGEYKLSVTGNPDWNGNYYGFCVDTANVQYAPTQYDIVPVADDGSKYERAAYIFSQHGSAVTGVNNNDTQFAAQLAVWEIVFDDATAGNLYGDNFKVNSGTYALAEQYVNEALAADLSAFQPTNFYLAKSPVASAVAQLPDYQDYMIYRAVPEPTLIILLGAGLVSVGMAARRRKRQ